MLTPPGPTSRPTTIRHDAEQPARPDDLDDPSDDGITAMTGLISAPIPLAMVCQTGHGVNFDRSVD
jgi:hypothetical protein